MAKNLEDGFKDIFLAGVGAMAITGEKAKEVVDALIEKGSLTVEQGKDINTELMHKASQTVSKVRTEGVEHAIKAMTPDERNEFAAAVARLVEEANATWAHDEVSDAEESASVACEDASASVDEAQTE